MPVAELSTERVEAPALSLPNAAVCLHFVEEDALASPEARAYPNCPVMRSMELDLLSYRFQVDPPLGSQCESHARIAAQIVFPERLVYQSEGRRVELVCPEPRRPVEIIISSTGFLRSGVRVWHVVIQPAAGSRFTEFDLIKLIHLYDGRAEATRLAEAVGFQLEGKPQVRASALLSAAYPAAAGQAHLRAGTIQILAAPPSAGGVDIADIVGDALRAPEDGTNSPDRLSEWVDANTPEGRALQACCGVVSGILDFDHLDADEIRDTLEPTVPGAGGLLRINRCTLTAIGRTDRIMEECRDTVGISPYLIIPHASLLHNEAMVDGADQVLAEVLSHPRAGLRRLEDAHARADLLLNRFYLPNVFNYPSERVLFVRGSEERGSDDRRAATTARLAELGGRISSKWEERRDRGQMCIAVLVSLISVLQLKDIVFSMVGRSPGDAAGWAVLGAAAVALGALIVLFWRLGVRR